MLCDDLEGWEAPVGGYIRTLLADSCCCTAETQHCTAIMLQFKKRVVLANHPHQKKETQDWDTRAKKNQCFMCVNVYLYLNKDFGDKKTSKLFK